MVERQGVWSSRRVSVAGALIVAVIAAAVAVTIVLYQAAIAQAGDARAAAADSQRSQQLVSIFAQQRLVMFRYFATGSSASLSSVEAFNTQFHQIASAVIPDDPGEAQILATAVAAQERYYSAFVADRRFVTASPARKFDVIAQLSVDQGAVTQPVNTVSSDEAEQATATLAAARSSAFQALAIGIAAAVLAVLAGAGFALFMIRTLRRAHQRELELTEALGRLTEALGRLGDRDELLARLRSASVVLGEVAAELRTAARNAAAVTSEQSAAGAQTSATIPQLDATARAIAHTARGVSPAADPAGE